MQILCVNLSLNITYVCIKIHFTSMQTFFLSQKAELADSLSTSNFNLKYFCSLLTYKNVQHLIQKI